MRKPGPLTYLTGNPLVVLLTLSATGYLGYGAWIGFASPRLLAVAFLIACQSLRATHQLQKYSEWKREWDAMEGASPTRQPLTMQSPVVRLAVGVPAWLVGIYMVMTVGDEPMAQVAKLMFWIGSAIGVGALIYRNVPRRAKAVADPAAPCVSVCVAVPRAFPTLQDARAQLPAYCRSLLKPARVSIEHAEKYGGPN